MWRMSKSESKNGAPSAAAELEEALGEHIVDATDVIEEIDLDTRALVVVGVGASEGGLQALQAMVAGLAGSKQAFIVAQHLSPEHSSRLVEMLASNSALSVETAQDGKQVEGGHIYVCPPGCHITLSDDGHLSVAPSAHSIYPTKPSIDLLFKSIAAAKGPRSIGIILSGTGADGTAGIGAIKDVDGFSIAQDLPSASSTGMPASAIESGKVDLVVTPDTIGAELQSIEPLADRPIPQFRSGDSRDEYDRILRLLKLGHGVNFSMYKDKTLSRRILRRMIANKTPDIADYAELLTTDAVELNELFHDLLIGVTHFFRDADAFEALRAELTSYIAEKNEPYLRIWSIGCSNGAEPYSIAILLAEILGADLEDYRIQVFATDVSQRSVEQARRGQYSASEVESLPEDIRAKYFVISDGRFEVSKHIKQMVVFSQHDVAQDPPFLRQDLVVCRNVLIYFGDELQDSLFSTFHYSLLPGGLLFLGQAETAGSNRALWEDVSAQSKLFRASAAVHRAVPRAIAKSELSWQPTSDAMRTRETPHQRIEAELEAVVAEQLERMLAPNVLVLNASDNILFSHGDVNPLLHRQPGLATDSIFQNIHPDLKIDLRTALHRVRSGEGFVSTDFRRVGSGSDSFWVRLVVGSTSDPQLGDLTVVYCDIEESLGVVAVHQGSQSDGAAMVVIEHEKQVVRLREQLSVVMEQLESSNEQMQALNEELQSSNEELQSANEELETTNEELQSTNEELQTAYAELRAAFDEKSIQEAELERGAAELTQAHELLVVAEAVGKTGSWRWRSGEQGVVWSPGLHALFSTTRIPSDLDRWLDLVHDEDRHVVRHYIESVVSGDEPEEVVFRVRLRAGDEPRWLSMTSAIERGQYRSVQEVIGTLRDVTEEHLAAEQVREQQTRLDAFEAQVDIMHTDAAFAGYVYTPGSLTVGFFDGPAKRVMGWTEEELRTKVMYKGELRGWINPEDLPHAIKHFAHVAELPLGGTASMEYRALRRPHPGADWTEVLVTATHRVFEVDEDGKALRVAGFSRIIGQANG